MPGIESLEPEICYVEWTLGLVGNCSKELIEEVFEWVADESTIEIKLLSDSKANEVESSLQETTGVDDKVAEETAAEVKVKEASKAIAEKSDKPPRKPQVARKEGGSIRVGIDKIDSLLNLVGELVITQSMLNRCKSEGQTGSTGTQDDHFQDGLVQLETNARELQDVAMKMRMLPIKTTFARFPRLVHDLSLQLGKKVNLEFIGEQTELDKTVLEKIGDPLVHLVRNALDHGLETPDVRLKAGKSEIGTLTLKARHEAGNIIIEVTDDGAGLNNDKLVATAIEKGLITADEKLAPEAIPYLIFHAGFSTAKVVSDVSGRGVGMDVVKRNIADLGGRVEVKSEFGIGSTFTIRLPLTLAILDGQLVKINQYTYVIPLLSIIETVVVDESRLNIMAGKSTVYSLRNEYIPVINLVSELRRNSEELPADSQDIVGKLLVIVESGGKLFGLAVDDLLDQQQVVLKSLDANYEQIQGLAGATILGDGTVSLIIDITGVIESCFGGDEQTGRHEMAAA